MPTALAYVLFARGLRHLPAGEAATLTLAEPLTATALGALVLGERPGAVALAGVALVLAGLAALAAPAARRARARRWSRRERRRSPSRARRPSTRSPAPCARASSTATSARRRRCASSTSPRPTASRATPCAPRCGRWPPRASCASSRTAARALTALDAEDLEGLGELRIALEIEAARLALARHGGRLPAAVHAAQRGAESGACADGAAPGFAAVAEAHEALHHAIVAASGSPRIVAAHRALGGELRLFLVQLRPAWDVPALAAEHAALLDGLEADGPGVLRPHIEASTRALLAPPRLTARLRRGRGHEGADRRRTLAGFPR